VARDGTETQTVEQMRARVERPEAELAAAYERAASLEAERDRVRDAFRALQQELELLRRRIFAAKAERVDTAQLELEFAKKLAALDALEGQLPQQPPAASKPKTKPTGRRDLSGSSLPVERIEIDDPVMEELVAAGRAERFAFEESSRLAWRRGGHVRISVVRFKYRVQSETETTIATAPRPKEILPRSLATPSLLAKIASDKYTDGLPLFRQEDRFDREGVPLDRGTMCRWLEELGNLAGATVIAAARAEAIKTAFCLATDATGILVQPIRTHEKAARQACRRGHFFVQIADRDHVFFEYTPRETSAAVLEMFRGFSGYVQADAKSVYDLLFREPEPDPPDDVALDDAKRVEVGCWAHARRYFYEAAITKDAAAREALYRIHRIFENEEHWTREAPASRRDLRSRHTRPHVDSFFAWAEVEYLKVADQRGLLRSAFGYVRRQKDALMRFLEDGRLGLDNNRSERELRRVALGRKNWLFVGSDDHAQATAALLSLIASAKLHALDPEAYLRDLFRVLPHWPENRYLELAARYWPATRARLDPTELERELGRLAIPPAPPS
jgi:transposase